MNIDTGEVHSVNGHYFRDVYEIVDTIEFGTVEQIISSEVLTPRCGWVEDHICSRACDVDCRNAQNLFNEVGIDY